MRSILFSFKILFLFFFFFLFPSLFFIEINTYFVSLKGVSQSLCAASNGDTSTGATLVGW